MPSPPLPPSAERIAPDAPICITMGEPSGIGPEVAVTAFHALNGRIGERPLKLVGDPNVFLACGDVPKAALIESHSVAVPRQAGKADPLNTRAVVDAIDEAVALARNGAAAAVVTAPIHKASLMQGGFEHAGHTQYLAEITGTERAVMMLAGGDLRVVPLTIHVALSAVPAHITKLAIVETGEIV